MERYLARLRQVDRRQHGERATARPPADSDRCRADARGAVCESALRVARCARERTRCPHPGESRRTAMTTDIQRSVEQFLYRKADLCDRRQWVDYLELFDPRSEFHIPQWES